MINRILTVSGIVVLNLLFAPMMFSQGVRVPIFISAEQLDAAALLPSPPADNSTEMASELAELHRLEKSRSAAEIARAKNDDVEEDIFIFKNILGEKFTREVLPLTAVLSDHVHNDESVITNPAKTFFHRPRPYQFDKTIQPVCKATSTIPDTYPSGHAVTGYLEALTLAMIVPEKRDAILVRADEYAHNRLVCGVHFWTDVAASKSVAYAMMGVMMNNPQFKKELDAARKETRQALQLTSK